MPNLNLNQDYIEFADIETQLAKDKLIKVLQDRLNLVNVFEGYLRQYHKPLTIESLGIRLESKEIIKWLKNNNKRIYEMFQYFKKNGSEWQKCRCQVQFKRRNVNG